MLRTCARVIALSAMVTFFAMTAQAADATLTLACQGTSSTGRDEANPEPISMGIIVDFTARTVQGFVHPGPTYFPVKITGTDDVTVAFEGRDRTQTVIGNINRVTGEVWAMSVLTDGKPHDIFNEPLGTGVISSVNYKLKCSPTQRKF